MGIENSAPRLDQFRARHILKISLCSWMSDTEWELGLLPHIATFTTSCPTFLFNHLSARCDELIFGGFRSRVLRNFRSRFASMSLLPLDTEDRVVCSSYGPRDVIVPVSKPELQHGPGRHDQRRVCWYRGLKSSSSQSNRYSKY